MPSPLCRLTKPPSEVIPSPPSRLTLPPTTPLPDFTTVLPPTLALDLPPISCTEEPATSPEEPTENTISPAFDLMLSAVANTAFPEAPDRATPLSTRILPEAESVD